MTGWTLTGSGGHALFGDTHEPGGQPRVCVVLLHGYLGYKDYGLIPVLGDRLAARGAVVHRFNFAYSGMTNATASFERPDLFAQQTWNSQVYDTLCVLGAVRAGRLAGAGLPVVLVGHSRGGATALLTAGRHAGRSGGELVDAVVTLAAPDACCTMGRAEQRHWLEAGTLEVRSGRTGQTMSLHSRWLEEQIADPAGHDLLGRAADIRAAVVAIHGDADETVPPESAERIAGAARKGRAVMIAGANHVFGMPNPPVSGGEDSPGFSRAVRAVQSLLGEVTDNRR